MLKKTSSLLRQFKPLKLFSRHAACADACVTSNFAQFLASRPVARYSKLYNGVTIATEERESCTASIGLFIDAGSRYESSCENGMAHFFEHIAFKGTCARNKETLFAQMACIGAKFKCNVSRELVVFHVECLAQDAMLATEILIDCVFNNAFNKVDIDYQKQVVYQEMLIHDKDPAAVTEDYLHATAFQGTPLAQSVMGPSNNLYYFNDCTVCRYLSKCYNPCRTVLATSGAITHEQVYCLANCYMGCLESLKFSDIEPYRYTGSEVKYRDDSMPTAHVMLAVEGPPFGDHDGVVLEVARFILGGWDRSQPGGELHPVRIAREASVCGLCDSYQAFHIAYKDCGLFGVHFVSGVMQLDDMMMLIQDEFMYISVCVTETEVERAKNFLKTKLLSQMDSELGACMDIGKWTLYRGCRPTVFNQLRALESVTVGQVRDTCSRYLYNKCPVVSAVGPREGLPEYPRTRSSMWWLRT